MSSLIKCHVSEKHCVEHNAECCDTDISWIHWWDNAPAPSLEKKGSLNIGFDFPLIASGTIFKNLQWLTIMNNEP